MNHSLNCLTCKFFTGGGSLKILCSGKYPCASGGKFVAVTDIMYKVSDKILISIMIAAEKRNVLNRNDKTT